MILVTGANGFVGLEVVKQFSRLGLNVLAITRGAVALNLSFVEWISVGDIDKYKGFESLLSRVDTVVHIAAIAHRKNISDKEFNEINTRFTINLAKKAITQGVNRFIFISSIGVISNSSAKQLTEETSLSPVGDYAISKYNAENELLALVKNRSNPEVSMDIVIIRPPLVYGPNPLGNFKSLVSLVKLGLPLPFGSVTTNKRSLVALENLVDFIVSCSDYKATPLAKNQIFLISDGEDVSTRELLIQISKAYKKSLVLLPIPLPFLRLVFKLLNKELMSIQLLESLRVSNSKALDLIGWKPVVTMEQQLKKMAEHDSKS